MPCSRTTATLRLITLWATRSAEDDAFSSRIGLGDVLQDNVIDIVAAGDLFADLDAAEQPAPYDRETQRRHELLEAWIAPQRGRAMNAQRRKTLTEMQHALRAAIAVIESVMAEEQDAFDNMPEALQSGEKGVRAQDAIDAMQEVLESIEAAIEGLDTAVQP